MKMEGLLIKVLHFSIVRDFMLPLNQGSFNIGSQILGYIVLTMGVRVGLLGHALSYCLSCF